MSMWYITYITKNGYSFEILYYYYVIISYPNYDVFNFYTRKILFSILQTEFVKKNTQQTTFAENATLTKHCLCKLNMPHAKFSPWRM